MNKKAFYLGTISAVAVLISLEILSNVALSGTETLSHRIIPFSALVIFGFLAVVCYAKILNKIGIFLLFASYILIIFCVGLGLFFNNTSIILYLFMMLSMALILWKGRTKEEN